MSSRRIYTSRSLAIVVVLGAAAAAFADDVVLVPGTTFKQGSGGKVRGTVQSETPSEIVVKLGANLINVPIDQVDSVRYDGQTPTLVLAESSEGGGQLEKAAELYKKAAAESEGKPFIEQAAKFKQADVTTGLALGDPGKAVEAVALLDAFVKAYPNTRHTPAALENLARLQLQKDDYSQVEKTIALMEKFPRGADRAGVLRAKVSAKKGDYAQSITELDKIIKASPDGSVRQREAKLAKAESLAGLKKYGEAEADLRAAIKSLPPEDVAAQSAAYNTLGDCLRAAGRPKDALLAYLHTDILYSKDKEQHPRALARIVVLWRELKRDDRADEVQQRLKQEYPQSPWTKPARVNP